MVSTYRGINTVKEKRKIPEVKKGSAMIFKECKKTRDSEREQVESRPEK
jgi:hypothetical protein